MKTCHKCKESHSNGVYSEWDTQNSTISHVKCDLMDLSILKVLEMLIDVALSIIIGRSVVHNGKYQLHLKKMRMECLDLIACIISTIVFKLGVKVILFAPFIAFYFNVSTFYLLYNIVVFDSINIIIWNTMRATGVGLYIIHTLLCNVFHMLMYGVILDLGRYFVFHWTIVMLFGLIRAWVAHSYFMVSFVDFQYIGCISYKLGFSVTEMLSQVSVDRLNDRDKKAQILEVIYSFADIKIK